MAKRSSKKNLDDFICLCGHDSVKKCTCFETVGYKELRKSIKAFRRRVLNSSKINLDEHML